MLLLLSNTNDNGLFEICVDSLRSFTGSDNIKKISQNKILIDNVKHMLPDAGIVTKKIYENFLLKVEQV